MVGSFDFASPFDSKRTGYAQDDMRITRSGYPRLPPCPLCSLWLKTPCKFPEPLRSSDRTGKASSFPSTENKGKRQ